MGVHNLWELLAPVGRRVSVETLAGKKLAIDASIWMIQFMKAMRDEKGEMVRNAHMLGFFRRICKLLFLLTKPVFVFDGGTPALKRRTVIARRRQRENAQTKIRKTAEKLLLNHLKVMRLKELENALEDQRQKNGAKGKRIMNTLEGNETTSKSYNQEEIDEMLAASLAAEGDEVPTGDASTSGTGILPDDEDGDEDEDEEMLLPAMHGKVDPAVLAALPPSMQLDLLVQMRERLMAENRQKYQKVKKAPAKFSELQIQAYLKTVAFRREIDEVQKSAGGRGIGGVQTSRIASEANREFIFSSSFTGNRQVLASAGVERNSNEQSQIPTMHPSADSVDGGASTKKSNVAIGSAMDETKSTFDEDVETYLDERGRVRVSKVRAMGIRMTRDLQRNLDLMKEIEQQRTDPNKNVNGNSSLDKATAGVPKKLSEKSQLLETSYQGIDGTVCSHSINQESIPINGTSIELSFEDDNEQKSVDSDDDLFAHIVVGDPVISFSADNTSSKKQPYDTVSDCEWEEGVIDDITLGSKPSLVDRSVSDESEVEWEVGSSDIPEQASLSRAEYMKTVSKGSLEEEADFQEAIRRSIEDLRCQNNIDVSSASEKLKYDGKLSGCFANSGSVYLEMDRDEPRLPLENVFPPNESLYEVVAGVDRLDNVGEMKILKTDDSPWTHLETSNAVNPDNMEVQIDKPCESYMKCHPVLPRKDASGDGSSEREIVLVEAFIPPEEKGVRLSKELHADKSSGGGEVLISSNSCSGVTSFISNSLMVDMTDVTLADTQQSESEAPVNDHSTETAEPKESVVIESKTEIHVVQKSTEERDWNAFSKKREDAMDKSDSADRSKEQVEITEASLEEEMKNLTKERADLGDEQRKLERNAESVSGEMFAECQELLQMFGLPYIIAPMEAEAQCAFMELENLVDGVVTDDSDVFLFGARSVFKNIFDDRKYVETYFMKDIENELGLTREKLIRMALLLGSDYTEGVSGIGIVNSVEVLNAFPEEDGLHKFREWIESPDPTILGKVDFQAGSGSRKRGSNSIVEGVSAPNQDVLKSDDGIQSMKQIFMDKHRNVSKNWHIPFTFPSEAVISAYASPQVDKSTEPFAWGKPDLFVLRKLCWEKFGWGTQKADELLQPVLKEYNKHESTRARKAVKYTVDDLEFDESGKTNQDDAKFAYEEAGGEEPFNDETNFVNAAAVGPSRSNRHELGDPSHEVRWTENNLEVGGGFCIDESELEIERGQQDWCQNGEILSETELSKEYLKVGGGFCMDEDKVDKDPGKCASSPGRTTILENPDPTHCSGLVEEAENDVGPSQLVSDHPTKELIEPPVGKKTEASENMQKVGSVNATTNNSDSMVALSRENIEENDDFGMRPASYLTAMPNLRRKRRKS